ncbi:MAG: DinB family protein [Gemmatimonadales bacterium]|nr:DinB family protein [Gemmatimonadales bacterium]MBP9202020.1 DinB family protein [Gemmatimonadales bacterium]
MTPAERTAWIARYREGPDRLEAALHSVSAQALQWRPAEGKWSVHEIVVHCADSETNAHVRVRYLLAEADPLLIGYDQDRWATVLGYHAHPLPLALATIRAVRANTLPLLERLTEADWNKAGRHTEHGPYGMADWLRAYGEHLEVHARQIGRNLEAWGRR